MDLKWIIGVALVVSLFGAAAVWRISDLTSDREALRAEVSRERARYESLETSIINLSQSNASLSNIQEQSDNDVATLRAIPSESHCGAPVHAAIDMLRRDAAAGSPDRR